MVGQLCGWCVSVIAINMLLEARIDNSSSSPSQQWAKPCCLSACFNTSNSTRLHLQTPCCLPPISLQVYDTAWHSSWYEFQSDLWTAVGKAHEALASGSERAPGALLTPGSAARAAQQQLLEDAYEFAELCWKSQDSRWEDVCCSRSQGGLVVTNRACQRVLGDEV